MHGFDKRVVALACAPKSQAPMRPRVLPWSSRSVDARICSGRGAASASYFCHRANGDIASKDVPRETRLTPGAPERFLAQWN